MPSLSHYIHPLEIRECPSLCAVRCPSHFSRPHQVCERPGLSGAVLPLLALAGAAGGGAALTARAREQLRAMSLRSGLRGGLMRQWDAALEFGVRSDDAGVGGGVKDRGLMCQWDAALDFSWCDG